jgi:hypothetical protein
MPGYRHKPSKLLTLQVDTYRLELGVRFRCCYIDISIDSESVEKLILKKQLEASLPTLHF